MIALELKDIGARIRDFEEMGVLWLLPTTLENQRDHQARSRVCRLKAYMPISSFAN